VLLLLLWALPHIGDPAPALDLATRDGKRLTAVPAGQVAVVEFFATWCGPCRENLDELHDLRAASDGRVQVIAVAVEGDLPRVRAYFAARPALADVVVAFDDGLRAAHRWGETRLPTTFFVDGGGVVRHINRGHGPGFRARAESWLRAMQAGPPTRAGAPTPAPATGRSD
jgi:cytochrome c biogenesis protein CcmG/thiol:disulfide interchange protein DsbE